MSRRRTTVASLLICLVVTTGCGSMPPSIGDTNNPTATAREMFPELRTSYQDLAEQLDVSVCRFTSVVGSSAASTQALRLAAADLANSSSWVTNHLAALPWPGTLRADSQILIRAIAAVEAELRVAANRTTRNAVTRHIHKARQLIARIPVAGHQLRRDLHLTDKSGCNYRTGGES
jgi:hypothetical protein